MQPVPQLMAITTIVNETMTTFNCKATLQSSHAFSEKYSQSLQKEPRVQRNQSQSVKPNSKLNIFTFVDPQKNNHKIVDPQK